MTRSPIRLALAAALSALLAACAAPPPPTAAILTYETVPSGATLYEGGQSLGVAPVSRRYEANGKPSITTPDVTAVWPSGAKTVFFTILKPGDDNVATLERPKNAPNAEVDIANGEKVDKEREKDLARLKAQQLRDQARASARCQAQMSGQGIKAPVDDCQ